METALLIIFFTIFAATAILTICALPGWVKIPDKYLKVLFTSLLLEVAGSVIILFPKSISPERECKYILNIDGKDWVVLNDDGQIFQLSINDSLKGADIGQFSKNIHQKKAYHLTLVKKGNDYLIKSNNFIDETNNDSLIDDKYLGKIHDDNIKALLFDEINFSEVSKSERIKYVKKNNGQWEIKDGKSLPKEWSLKIDISSSGYTISDIDANYNDDGIFDKNRRKLHFFKGSDAYLYTVHISDADNSTPEKEHYVTFTILRTEMKLELKK